MAHINAHTQCQSSLSGWNVDSNPGYKSLTALKCAYCIGQITIFPFDLGLPNAGGIRSPVLSSWAGSINKYITVYSVLSILYRVHNAYIYNMHIDHM